MTEKLYYLDSHMFEFEAEVLECRELERGWGIILDRTAFFPEGGGQPADTGVIGGVAVTDVQERGGEIIHYSSAPAALGRYSCRIDREQRLRRMQNHSGEHIVSGLVHNIYGYENVGFHMSAECMTIDFSGELDWAQLMDIERRANEAVRADLPVRAWFPEPDELARLSYRSKLELTEDVRIVEIGDIDRCACCAPHVRRTGEVGGLKVMHVQNYKGGVRISILCGFRALDAFRQKTKTVDEMMGLLSSSEEELRSHIKRLQTENQNLAYALRQAQEKILAQEAKGLDADAEDVVLFADACDSKAMRSIVNDMVKDHAGYCAIFAGGDEQGYQFIVGSRTKDCRQEAAHLRETFDARGGGGTQMIQGSVRAAKVHLAENWMA